jgi:hypothetical protein
LIPFETTNSAKTRLKRIESKTARKCSKDFLLKKKNLYDENSKYQHSNMSQFNSMIQQTCPDMSRLVIILWYDLIRFYKHFQTCLNAIWYNRIISCPSWNSHVNMSRLVLNHKMTEYSKIWANGRKKVLRQSYSLDRFGKRAVKNFHFVTTQSISYFLSHDE